MQDTINTESAITNMTTIKSIKVNPVFILASFLVLYCYINEQLNNGKFL